MTTSCPCGVVVGAFAASSSDGVVKTTCQSALALVSILAAQALLLPFDTWFTSLFEPTSGRPHPVAGPVTSQANLRSRATRTRVRARHGTFGEVAAHCLLLGLAVGLVALASVDSGVDAAKPRPWRKWPDMEQWGVGQPGAAFGHTMTAMDDGTLWVLAGGVLYKRDLEMKQWSTMTTSGPEPSDRRNAAMATTGEYLYVHGGKTGSQYSDELWAYSIKTGLWSLLASTGNKPSDRAGHAMTPIGTSKTQLGQGGGASRNARYAIPGTLIAKLITFSN